MRLYNNTIANFNSNSRLQKEDRSNRLFVVSNPFAGDVISFRGKDYNSESILEPTNHCAYCGCKVYTETQINSIAQEMLKAKANRLDGKIKSVLEKLSEGKNSQELSTAKRIENNDEIKFFQNFLDIADKKSYLRGETIFEQVYNLDKEEAQKLLVKNMHPLLKTIDHVTPQNQGQENDNVDTNLVEACYCCNHDLKKGASFDEFYTMFPTIKNNMPKQKFDFALAKMLETSQPTIKKGLSATNILKLLERLFVQKSEAAAYLDSVNLKIKSCSSGIETAIQTCESDIETKQAEIEEMEAKMTELESDLEYQAILKRMSIEADIKTCDYTIEGLRNKRQRIGHAIDDLTKVKKSSKSSKLKKNAPKIELNEDEKKTKIADYKKEIADLNEQINSETEKREELKFELDLLNEEYPSMEMHQNKKSKVDNICNAYSALRKEKQSNAGLNSKLNSILEREQNLKEEIAKYPEEEFSLDIYPAETQAKYERYKTLTEAAGYIEAHPNLSYIKSVINQSAYNPIKQELEELAREPVIIAYKDDMEIKKLKNELSKLQNDKKEIEKDLNNSNDRINTLSAAASVMTLEEAIEQSTLETQAIKILNEKQDYTKLPQKISVLKAEITYLHSTIADLETRLEQISKTYN